MGRAGHRRVVRAWRGDGGRDRRDVEASGSAVAYRLCFGVGAESGVKDGARIRRERR